MPRTYRRAATLGGGVVVIALFTMRMLHASAPSGGPPPSPSSMAGASEGDLRRHYGLIARPRFEAFEVSDGAGRMTITLPAQPAIDARFMTDGGGRAYITAATMREGARVITASTIAFVDVSDAPGDGLDLAEGFAQASASQLHGVIERDEVGTLAGLPARIVDVRLPEHRRLLSWYAADAANACLYAVICVDQDTDAQRHACAAIAQSLAIAPMR